MSPNAFFHNIQQLYDGRQPPWHEAAQLDGVGLLEAAAASIRDELGSNLADPVRAAICFRKWGLKKQIGWRQIELAIYGVNYAPRQRLFPITCKVLQQIDGVSTAYFSVLAPHTTIAPHVGDTDAYYRVHLGLKVPAGLPSCGIEVAGTQKAWEEGKCLAFTDIYCHTAWNDTDQERVVLIVDILRPELRNRKTWVDAGMRATLYWSRIYARGWPLLELLPRFMTRLGRPLLHGMIYGYHKMRKR